MKASDETLKEALGNIQQLANLAQSVGDLSKNTVPSLFDKLIREVPQEQREAAQRFVQDSNELISKSGKLEFAKVQELIKKHETKHGKSAHSK
jgi:hypothetical protein